MKWLLPILALVCSVASPAWEGRQSASAPAAPKSASESAPAAPVDPDARKAKALIDQAIEALGGQTYLTIRDREQTGRSYGFHHGRSSGSGALFWLFSEFPDKERFEITKERDIAELYVGDKAWEITYKGAKPLEKKDLEDYMRRRRFSLETVLRSWANDPRVVVLYMGNAIAGQHSALQVTLINPQNEAVNLFFDVDTHLPVKKSFEWRDPVDRQKNLEEEIYENYREVSGVMTPYNVTRYFNGDMSNERFLFTATINQGLDETMFDPHSSYNPNKPPDKRKSK